MKVHKIIPMIALLASMQAFAWKIQFEPSTYGHTFEIMTFEKESDYKGMGTQRKVFSGINKALGVIAPVAGKLGSAAIGSRKKDAQEGEDKQELYYSKEEIAAINVAINAGSDAIKNLSASKGLLHAVESWTKEGYTIDLIEAFTATAGHNIECRDERSLKKHMIHPIKSNKPIFFVIYDKTTQKVIYANWGLAYGEFTFSIETITAENSTNKAVVGNLKEVSTTGGQTCSVK